MSDESSSYSEIGPLVDLGGVGFARGGRPAPYYLRLERLTNESDPPGFRFAEITFNPTMVDIDGDQTDVLVCWGSRDEVIAWATTLLSELDVDICPTSKAELFIQALFGPQPATANTSPGIDPWDPRLVE